MRKHIFIYLLLSLVWEYSFGQNNIIVTPAGKMDRAVSGHFAAIVDGQLTTWGGDSSRKQKWMKRLLALLAGGCLMVAILAGYNFWNYYYNIGVTISATPEQNIAILQRSTKQETPEVAMTSDCILGVAMDFYAIHGLKASIEFEEPDTADTSVYLYCRSADHTANSKYLGSLVADGKEYHSDTPRLGYMAMLGGNSVNGISRSEKAKDFIQERGSSFFRQLILVSDDTIPSMARWSSEPLAASETSSTSSPHAPKEPSGALLMPSTNTASLMPSTSLVVQAIASIAVRFGKGMTLAILTITHRYSGSGLFRS